MANIRRGVVTDERVDGDCAARANGAIIESRNGSDRAMPVPRRKRRREIRWRLEANGAETASFDFKFIAIGWLFHLEQITPDNFMHHCAQTELTRTGTLHDSFDLFTI